jgi:hypothetical protein
VQRLSSRARVPHSQAVAYLRSFPTQAFNLWGSTEWARLGVAEKPEFSAVATERGVRIVFYLSFAEKQRRGLSGGLAEDGALEIDARRGQIICRSERGSVPRRQVEEVIWQRLVLQITKGIAMERAGARPSFGTVRGFYPCSMEKEIAYMSLRRECPCPTCWASTP